MSTTRTGIDAVASLAASWKQLAAAAGNPQVIGSYGNGAFANTSAAREGVPKATHVQYDVNGSLPEMDLLDIEPRDAVPGQAPGWAHRHNAAVHGKAMVLRGPGLYCSAGTTSQVVSAMLDAGWKRSEFLIHSAHYTGRAHICGPDTCGFPQADAAQWNDKGPHGENIDMNLWAEHCFTPAKAPDPDARYGLFDARKRSLIGGATERGTVIEYDRWRATQTNVKHPHRARLAILRLRLRILAKRLQRVIAAEKHPSANQLWRLRELQDRAKGMQLV